MPARLRIGVLTPSSNTALEPLTAELLSALPRASAHFSRFPVTEIALSDKALGQFAHAEILRAAELLAHARVDVIVWSGTSAGWLGFEHDERLCEAIEKATGIRACTSVLAFRDAFQRRSITRVGLVTPYRSDVQARIVANWGRAGFACVAERHLGLQDNFSFAEVEEDEIAGMAQAVAAEGCEAIAILCTNLRGARVAPALEAALNMPVYDSVAMAVWAALEAIGADTRPLRRWGGIFDLCAPASDQILDDGA